ncbi:MAG: hypothetical protein EOP22_17810 [Hyphomicrobiales bacterium]|nr:MAG: hypothetical protein EOP22_17810 [Hyphomicrobiales bacterium]
MIIYLTLVLICLGFGLFSISRLIHDRFPHPADVATVSLIYYALPLSVAGYFYLNYGGYVFLNTMAGDQGLAFQSAVYLTVALLSLSAGRVAASMSGQPASLAFVPLTLATERRVQGAYVVLIGLIALGVVMFGVVDFLAGYAEESRLTTAAVGNALVYWSVEGLGFLLMMTLLLSKQRWNASLRLSVIVSLIVLAIVFLVRAKRLEIVVALLPVALIIFSRRSSITSSTYRVIGIGVAVAALVLLASARVSTTLDPFYTIFYVFSEGLYAGHTLPGVEARVAGGGLGYEYGIRYINGVIGFIPSFLWEGKEDMIYAGNLQLQELAPLGATSFLAEVVLQGGLYAVVATYSIMGFISHRLTYFQASWDSAVKAGFMPFRFGIYAIMISVFIPHFRDGIIPAMKLSLQALVFYLALTGINLVVRSRASAIDANRVRLPG